jgi:deoxyribodipyrimidine photo-lyase
MKTRIYWFRNDLRLTDNPAFIAACDGAAQLLPVHVISSDETAQTTWGFERWGPLRRRFRDQAVAGLRQALIDRGSNLIVVEGDPVQVLSDLAQAVSADRVACETIAAPEEQAQVEALRRLGVTVEDHWQSSLIAIPDLPFAIPDLPEVFTPFRRAVETAGLPAARPVAAPPTLPPLPSPFSISADRQSITQAPDLRSSFPFDTAAFDGAESTALNHLRDYFSGRLAQTYKVTRNGLSGVDYSTKFSPWLATGALSSRTVFDLLRKHEDRHGASEGSAWIAVELLWRDYFRFSALKHGTRLFRHKGLSRRPKPSHDPEAFRRWTLGETGQPFVDAGQRELATTGYLSNRMRQVVASYLIHDLDCDWRAGAAWFEARLIDFDICSNQGNWLYIAGRGADPRNGRRFAPEQQGCHYGPDGAYQRLWDRP